MAIQEALKLCCTMTSMEFADYFSGGDIQSLKQRSRSMPFVVGGSAFDLSGSHRQQWSSSIQRLDLRFLVDA